MDILTKTLESKAGGSRAYILFARLRLIAGEAAVAKAPVPLPPKAEAIEIEVDDRRRIEGQDLAYHQTTDNRNTEWASQFGALAKPDGQG